jgi:hypothetical protein
MSMTRCPVMSGRSKGRRLRTGRVKRTGQGCASRNGTDPSAFFSRPITSVTP